MKTWWNILTCMLIYFIHGAVNVSDEFELTSSPLLATDGDLFTLTCSIRDESTVNIGWWQNNKPKVVTQKDDNCIKRSLAYGQDIINRINVNCSTTAHSMTFRFSFAIDQGAEWQCGKQVSDSYIHPRSNNYTIGLREHDQTSSPVMSKWSLSTTTRTMETASDPQTVTTQNGTAGHGHTSSPVMSTQSSSTTTKNMGITSDQETVTTKNAFTVEKDPNLLYIVVGAVGGAVLLTFVVVGVVCIRQRRIAAHQQNDMKEERNNKASRVYQNTTGNNTVENDLYEGSSAVQPMDAAANQEDDFMLSDAYASVDMPVTNTCTRREEVPSGDVNLENLYAEPDKSRHTEVQQVSDIYAEVQKPKKKKQDHPMVSEDFNTGDVYAKPNKSLKAQK